MELMRRAIILGAFLSALAAFCVVQDRVTAAAARSYVARQRQGAGDTVGAVMEPAIRDSVRQGLLWGGGVLAAGLASWLVVAVATGGRQRAAAGSAAGRRG